MTSRRTALILGAATAGGFLLNRGALAADTIRLIVPFERDEWGPHRLFQEPFAKAMGMAVVPDYVPGEGGKLGARETIRSKPDSRTLLIHLPDALANWEHQGDKLLANLRPVAKITRGMSDCFVVRADSALKDWQGMAAASKVSALTMAYYGGGGILLLAMVKKRAGLSFQTQPTDGLADSAAMLLSGKAALSYFPTDWVLTHNEKAAAKDKLRLLATFGAARHPELPAVPTFAEIVGDRKAATTFSVAVWSAANADTAFTDKATAALLSIAKTPKMLAEARELRVPLQIDGPQVVLETLKRDRRVLKDVYG